MRIEPEHSSLATVAAAAIMLAGRLNAGVVFAYDGFDLRVTSVDLRVTSDMTVADVVRQYHEGVAANVTAKATVAEWVKATMG